MNEKDFIIIMSIIGLPAIFYFSAVAYLGTNHFKAKMAGKHYNIAVFERTFVLSKRAVIRGIALLSGYLWIDLFAPSSLAFAVQWLIALMWGLAKFKETSDEEMRAISDNSIAQLSNMQTQIANIKQHLGILGQKVATEQAAIQHHQSVRHKLELEIAKNKTLANMWTKLSELERQGVAELCSDVVPKETKSRFWLGLAFGGVLSLLATAVYDIWVSPEKQTIVKWIGQFWE